MISRSFAVVLVTSGLSIFGSACAGGNGTQPLAPLTDAQKALVKSTATGLSSIENTPPTAAASPLPTPSSSPLSSPLSFAATADVTSVTQEEKEQHQEEMMANAIQQSNCAFQVTGDIESSSFGSSPSEVKISGSSCPVNVDFKVAVSTSGNQMTTQFDMDYLVTEDSFRKLNDIDALSLHGPVVMQGVTQGASQTSPDLSPGWSVNATLSGKIHSQSMGEIGFSMSGQGSADSANYTVKYVYSAFTAELKAQVDSSGTQKYTINGQEITQDEFDAYVSDMGKVSASSASGQSNTATN